MSYVWKGVNFLSLSLSALFQFILGFGSSLCVLLSCEGNRMIFNPAEIREKHSMVAATGSDQVTGDVCLQSTTWPRGLLMPPHQHYSTIVVVVHVVVGQRGGGGSGQASSCRRRLPMVKS